MAAVALTARQEPPPTVAEFAPQAVEQIEEALPEQAEAAPSAVGPGSGSVAPEPTDEPSTAPTPTVTDVEFTEEQKARVRRCVGDPPRQTEDPQSPPCVNFFEGDNGGETWKGVTADEIRVAYPNAAFGTTAELARPLADHFNDRYEFYGRKIVLVGYNPADGTFAQPNPTTMISDAVKVDEQIRAFASLGFVDRKGAEYYYYDELARRGVISVAGRLVNNGTEERLRSFAPYQWNIQPSIETAMALIGSSTCQTLAGRPPDGGGIGTAGAEERVFGMIVNSASDGSVPPFEIVVGQLASCGVELAAVHQDASNTEDYTTAVIKMRDAGVTSVMCLCAVDTAREGYTQAATQQVYFPEWVMSSYLSMDLDNSYHGTLPEQQQNVLGISMGNKMLPRQQMPWWQAYTEYAGDDPSGGVYYDYNNRYQQLLLLASGIQAAGPNLTPETFQAGLHSLVFPNPGAGGPPLYQARVGFEGGRHTMTDSASFYWYSPDTGGTVDPAVVGAICYVNGGRRYFVDGFSSESQPFFQDPCR